MTAALDGSTLRHLRHEVDEDLERHVATILELAGHNSGSTNPDGVGAVQRSLAIHLGRRDVSTTITDLDPLRRIDHTGARRAIRSGPVLRGRFRSGCARRVLVMGHADTVFGPDDPFQSVERSDGRLHGPGVADMKGGLVCLLAALELLERHQLAPDLGIDICVNGDEEVGSLASQAIIADCGRAASAALVLEPRMADGSLARARAGSANLTFSVIGRGAHAGRALAEGRNAVVAAGLLAAALSELDRDGLGVNVAALHGGEAFNSVPATATLRVNMRSQEPDDLRWALDRADELAADVGAAREVTIERTGGIHRPAKPWTAPSQRLSELVDAVAADLGSTTAWVDTGGVCDGNNLAALGLGVVDTLGVHGSGIHTPEERMDLDRFGEAAALLAGVIHAIAVHPEIEPEVTA